MKSLKKSSFLSKSADLLLIFYLYENDKELFDYLIKIVDEWVFPDEDLKIIENDWLLIQNKVKNGLAHESSEGDTLYLGACTKGSNASSSYREQPFSKIPAKQRAYCLKQGYVNHIIASSTKDNTDNCGKVLNKTSNLENQTLEQIVQLIDLNLFIIMMLLR